MEVHIEEWHSAHHRQAVPANVELGNLEAIFRNVRREPFLRHCVVHQCEVGEP